MSTPKRASGILYVAWDRRMLLVRRSGTDSFPGHWGIPGGSTEDGETALEGALRECREEVGGVFGILRLDSHAQNHGDLEFTTFIAQMDGRRANFELALSDEHDRYGWFLLKELPSPLHPGLEELLEKIF